MGIVQPNNLLKTEIATGINITAERLQTITKQLVPNVEQESHRLLAEVQNELGEKDATGNVLKPKPIFLAITEDLPQVKKLLVQTAQSRCDRAREHSIAKELAGSPQLASIIRNQFDQATVLAQTSGLEDQTSHIATVNHFRWVGTGSAQNDPAVNAILELVPGNYRKDGFGVLPDPYQLIFAEEKGIFPLRCLPFLRDYEKHYQNLMKDADPSPRETDKRIAFRDLFPEPKELQVIRQRATDAALLGQVFGFLHEAEDPATHYPAIYLSYYDEEARDMARTNLCRDWDAAPLALGEPQQAKEIEQENVFEATPMELLEREIEKKGQQAVTRTDRERLWLELQTYLDSLRARLSGGDLHPEYGRQRKIMQAFREHHNLQAPQDFRGGADTEGEGNVRRHNLQAPQDFTVQPQAASAPTAPATEPSTHKHAEAFRKKVQAALATAPVLDESTRGKLLKNGIEFWKLPPPLAQRILQEESARQANGNLPANLERYRELFLMVIESGRIEQEERARLQEEQQALGLSREAVHSIEHPHTARLYRRWLEEALFGPEIDGATREVLREHQAVLNLTDAQARQLETEFLAQAQQVA